MAIALQRLKEQERRAKGRYQPILFVVAVCKVDAKKAWRTLNDHFKVKTLLVTEDTDEEDRRKARELGEAQRTGNPYKAVVSVLMLREGWDVPEVGVILLLRKFSSKVYGQQVIGRGLRRVRTKGVAPSEPQICAIVDHPKLDHEWLWQIFNAKKRVNVSIDDLFDETEDLPPPPPKQELTKPHLVIRVPDPDPNFVDEGEFTVTVEVQDHAPIRNWREVLEGIQYEPTAVEITRVDISGVVEKELGTDGWHKLHSAPFDTLREKGEPYVTAITDDELRDLIRTRLLEMAEELLIEAGCATLYKDRMYQVLLEHVRHKFLSDPHCSLGLAERYELDYIWRMLPQVKQKIASIPGLVKGVVHYGDE